jgi:hypothetical protein
MGGRLWCTQYIEYPLNLPQRGVMYHLCISPDLTQYVFRVTVHKDERKHYMSRNSKAWSEFGIKLGTTTFMGTIMGLICSSHPDYRLYFLPALILGACEYVGIDVWIERRILKNTLVSMSIWTRHWNAALVIGGTLSVGISGILTDSNIFIVIFWTLTTAVFLFHSARMRKSRLKRLLESLP